MRWYLKAVLAAAGAVLLATAVMAAVNTQNATTGQKGIQKGVLGGMFRPGAALRGLDLSQQQRDQVKAIVANHKADIKKTTRDYAQARLLLVNALATGASDQDVKAAFDSLTAAGWNAVQLRRQITGEIKPILTPDQQARLQQRLEKIDARIQKRLKKLG